MANRFALAAAQRLLSALAPTQSRGPACGRLLAPDGRYEHASMTALILPAADIDLLCATAATLGHPVLDPDIAIRSVRSPSSSTAANAGPTASR
jgi:hypothetical protein